MTLDRIAWSSTYRLLEPTGYLPPAECETPLAALQITAAVLWSAQLSGALGKPGRLTWEHYGTRRVEGH